jgi:class 3 adenylate cyclase/tetratricopeptide (TPR) repeat protein
MKCLKCGYEIRFGAKFCEECGAHVAPAYANCGTQHSAATKFCSECGQRMSNATPSSSSPHFATPDVYTPHHLAERILTSKTALEGERKLVTMLFADLKGSMELFADRDPEEARRLLDPVIDQLMNAVHRYEGTVNHVLGDGIVALFGAPIAHEDHAVRACYAALRMQETVKRYADDVRRNEGIPIQIRVGLNSGEVVVRSIGSDLRMDYTVVGQTTNVAARMEQMALPGSILISTDTMRLAEGYVQAKSLGPLKVKGLERPLEVFEVTGAATVRSRLHAVAARGLTRFVGRDNELDQLRQALERARSGHGQIVAVVGEPGVGKSRLFWEFTHSPRTQGWLVVESSSVSYGKATSFLPIIDLLKRYFQVESIDEARRVREKLTGKLLSLDRGLEPFLPALLWLLDIATEDEHWTQLEPSQRREQALEGVKRLLLRESQEQPLLVLFEDLHWIDLDTQALLDSLVESLPKARLLLLVNYRPEYQHNWNAKTFYRQLSIEPLPPESAEQLLRALLGDDAALQPLKQLLIARTEGNPFFLEESIRTLIETKALIGERGAFHVAKGPQSLQIPATAQAILAARIDRLSPEDKRLLQAASVIGKDVPIALLQAIAELSDDGLRGGLSRLQAAEFLYEARLFPDLEYSFKHALTHDIAYSGMLKDRRCTLHRQILEAIERLYPDRPEHIEQLAHHALRGEAWEKAVTYLRQAGIKAATRSTLREAVTYLELALDALERLPQTCETMEQAIDLRFDLQGVLYPLGGIERTLEHLRQAQSLAETLGDQLRLGRVSGHMTYCFYWMGELEQAVIAGQRARAIASALNDFSLQISTNVRLGQAYFAAGEFRRAAELFEWNIAKLEDDRADQPLGLPLLPSAFSRDRLGWCLATIGEFTAARRTLKQGVVIAESLNHPYTLGNLYCSVGWACMLQGDLENAISWVERARNLVRGDTIPLLTALIAWRLGEAYAVSGRSSEGLCLLEQAVEQLAAMGHMGYYPRAVTALGLCQLLAGRPAEAQQSIRLALELSRAQKQPGVEAEALRVLGDIEASQAPNSVAEADATYRQALALAIDRGMRPLAAHCHRNLGELHRRAGDHAKAEEYLATATALYREMDMRLWLDQAEKETTQFRSAPSDLVA